jgi:FkbM family methyltransferase
MMLGYRLPAAAAGNDPPRRCHDDTRLSLSKMTRSPTVVPRRDARTISRSLALRLMPQPMLRRLRVARFEREHRAFDSRIVEHDYAGRRLQIRIATPYGERYDRDWPELEELRFLRAHKLRPGARVFDLGASHGIVALMLADAVGPQGEVIALEADPTEAAAAQENADVNGVAQLRCLHAAAGRYSGTIAFGLNGEVADADASWGAQQIEAWSVDDLAKRHGAPDLVFIDVEGFEQEVLAGASGTLAARPDWFVEVHVGDKLGKFGGSVEAILEHFPPDAYDLYAGPDDLRIAPDGTLFQEAEFRPVAEVGDLLSQRFFLVAVGRR